MSEFKKKFEAAILLKQKQWGVEMASYKGLHYEIKVKTTGGGGKNKEPFSIYNAICEDLDIESGWQQDATSAGNKLRKLIDESIKDRDGLSSGKRGVALAGVGELKTGDKVTALDDLRQGRVKKGDQGVVVDAGYSDNFVDVKFNGKVETMNVNQVRKA